MAKKVGRGILYFALFCISLRACGAIMIGGHDWQGATCTEPRTCATCNAQRGKPLGHDWQEATCMTPKTCARCGESEGDCIDHDWVNATCTEAEHCSMCGKERYRNSLPLGHEWREATCIAPMVCAKCGETKGEKSKEHKWEDATCISPKKCSVCGKTEGEKTENHLWEKPTCTEKGKCVHCGKENLYSEPLGHDWKSATTETPMACNRCGITMGEPVPLSSFNRGIYDKQKAKPLAEQYVGISGYIAVTQDSYLYLSSSNSPYENNWLSKPWYATTYEKDRQLWNAVGTVEHKTPVTVIAQELTNERHWYTGFLLVERCDNKERFYVSVTDFVAEPYWESLDVENIGNLNPCLAVYQQCSDYYPVDRNGKKYNIADGETVLICSSGLWGGVDRETNPIEIIGKNGRGFFNADDLRIIY